MRRTLFNLLKSETNCSVLNRTLYHPAGTSAMGSVVDSEMRVYGIDRLRIVDASVIPAPIAGHLQVAVYALAEQAADIIVSSHDF